MKNGEYVQERLRYGSKPYPLRKWIIKKKVKFYPLGYRVELYCNGEYKGTLTRPYVVSVLRSLNMKLSDMVIESSEINRMF